MALFQIDYFAKTLGRKTQITVVIPSDIPPGIYPALPDVFKPVYLLHGYSENNNAFIQNAPLQELSGKYGAAFIMPSGENSFYLNDAARGALYEDYICGELPEIAGKFFPLSKDRKDVTVAGISMGGFGAIHSGLASPGVFGNIISYSAALITDGISKLKEGEGNQVAPYSYYRHTFGDLSVLLGGHNDPKALAASIKPEETPNIYMCCGSEDFLINENRGFHETLQRLGVKHTYEEEPGVHDWQFWNRFIPRSMEWLCGDSQ
ncbi:MAG: esterase family protein [Clostridiales bacterium]|jgi:S-formylglutathione hydrolase FrmB|nr:esterase family protein [Clostridiales bacterium]